MSKPWLHIIGIGEDGLDSLSAAARQILLDAEVIVGGERHHGLSLEITAERLSWPSPFDAMIETIKGLKGRRVVILVTGDPLWYSVGARITKAINASEIRFHPQLSAFQLAACRLGWSLPDCETLTVHGRADSQIVPYFAPGVRMLVLAKDATSPAAVVNLLVERGFGESRIWALAALGGKDEQLFVGTASDWHHTVPDFHTMAIECLVGPDAVWHPRLAGLPEDAFVHDGQITKREVRAATLARLAPYPNAIMWDIGAGCGSVSIEWMRSAREACAYAIEPVAERCAMIAANAKQLGTEKIRIIKGHAPTALVDLPAPDAVFIGGGIGDQQVFDFAFAALKPGGRLVANVVTVEGENRLGALYHAHGGEMSRIAVERLHPVGRLNGWRSLMSVTQWAVVKSSEQP